jgi:hypothetical protein
MLLPAVYGVNFVIGPLIGCLRRGGNPPTHHFDWRMLPPAIKGKERKGRKWRKRKAEENHKRAVNGKSKEKSQPGGSLHFGLKNQQERRMADHNGSTDVSTTPLLGVLDTNHHVSHVCM